MGCSSARASRARAPPFCGAGIASPPRCSRPRWRAPRRTQFGAGAALHSVATACSASPAVLAMVVGRLGRPLALSWLDFAMGGCAVGALAVTTGAELPATIARLRCRRGARARALARERRARVRAGRADRARRGTGAGGRARSRPPRGCASRPPTPGPEFSPVVLAALLAYAATALTLLVVGQFVSLPPVAAALATVTVLTGMARAGLTIVDRLRVSAPPGRDRRPDRARQPPPSARAARRGDRRHGRARSRCC